MPMTDLEQTAALLRVTPAGSDLELTHFAIESAIKLLSVLPKLPHHHPKNLKLAFRASM